MSRYRNGRTARLGVTASLLAVFAILLAACAPAVSNQPATESPLTTQTVETPVPQPATPRATEALPGTGGTEAVTPSAMATEQVPSITVEDQAISADKVITIQQVVSPNLGWVVVQADNNGQPGDVLGYWAVRSGVNQNVPVTIDTSMATQTLYVTLYNDLGRKGTFEVPGADTPVEVNGNPVMQSFQVTGGLPTPEATQSAEASVTVEDQAVSNGAVTIAQVISPGPGWIVIHADNNGQPGAVVGYTAVQQGQNDNVTVEIDQTQATPTLYAMLHQDAGTTGTYEFPGPDTPVEVNGNVVMQSFQVTGLQ